MAGPLSFVEDNREKLLLVVYAIAILAFAGLLSPMLGQAWQRANISVVLLRLGLLVGLSVELVSVILFGMFFGLLTLMVVDTKKRLQGVLLFTGGTIGIIILSSMGLLLPNIDIFQNILWLLGGLIFGLAIGGGQRLLDFDSTGPLEFRRASQAIYYALSAIVVVGFFEYHVNYPFPIGVTRGGFNLKVISPEFGIVGSGGELVLNLALVVGFVGITRQFVRYDAERDFLVLGPKASGKSLFLVGAYLEALERFSQQDTETPLNPSQDLMSLVSALDRQGEGWFVEATRTQELEELEFQYVHGNVFPENIEVSTLDYAGEWLEDLPDALAGVEDREALPSTLLRVSGKVIDADTLILLIDSSRWVDDEPLGIEPYFDIIQSTGDKDIILVATKADVFAEDFRDERGLDAQQYFSDFKQYVNQQVKQDQTVQSLVAQAGGSAEIHPVYFQTKVNEDGERVPMRVQGSVTTVGFDALLERLGRD